mmetsp:Transcript_49900/g.154303  ORF Transcript_49900/g.154303 Transcript_49900/m.154303 type:complete len:133 (+) Transcript_49900:1544-1942(+)
MQELGPAANGTTAGRAPQLGEDVANTLPLISSVFRGCFCGAILLCSESIGVLELGLGPRNPRANAVYTLGARRTGLRSADAAHGLLKLLWHAQPWSCLLALLGNVETPMVSAGGPLPGPNAAAAVETTVALG